MTPNRRRPAGSLGKLPRQGSVLPLVAVLLFVLLPLMALVIDIGMVTLTRRQMQAAVNAGAIEGLRVRDDESFPTPEERRVHVQTIVGHVLSASGMGPNVELSEGIDLPETDFQASRTIDTESLGPFFLSPLELNLEDDVTGDMAAGQWIENEPNGTDHREGPISGSDQELDDPYERKDFKTKASETTGSSGLDYAPSAPDDAFLVRLRRVAGETGVAEISTVGPPVPFLFGRIPAGDSSFLNSRERGVSVRATGIASARPAMTVGVPSALVSGVATFRLPLATWEALVAETPVSVDLDNSDAPGSLLFEDREPGEFMEWDLPTINPGVPERHSLSIGQAANGGEWGSFGAKPINLELEEDRYIPITDNINGTVRIVGFGCGHLVGQPGEYQFVKRRSRVASSNASSKWQTAPSGLSAADWTSLLTATRRFDPDVTNPVILNKEPLLAPALRRTVH